MPLGPPIPGAPWAKPRRLWSENPYPNQPTSSTTAGTGKRRHSIRRVPRTSPDAPRRLAAETEKIADIVNDLLRQGLLVREEAGTFYQWTISGTVAGPQGDTGPAGPQGDPGAGSLTLTGDITGSGVATINATLNSVNSNVGSFTNANVTVNAKGLVTAAASGTGGSVGGGPTIVIAASNQAVTSSAAFVDDAELIFAIGASEVWIAEWVIYYKGGAAGDIQFAIAVPSGATGIFGGMGLVSTVGVSGSVVMASRSSALDDTNAYGFGNPGTTEPYGLARMSLQITNSVNAGNVKLRWTQLVSDGTATTRLAGSHLIAHRKS